MAIIETINDGIKEAMKSRDQLRLDTLRMLKSKILNVDARGNVADEEVIKIFKTYSGNLHEALEQSKNANRPESVEKLKKELEIIQEFLPKALSHEETLHLVKQAIIESGAKTKKDVGLVMKSMMKNRQSLDGKLAKEMADQLLTD